MPTYRVSTWDPGDAPDDWDWTVVATGLSRWQLRGALRELYGRGYGEASILVQREQARAAGGKGER